ncbi:MAG: TlpA family protein disulfide reductase [Pseudomonadota bacterium]
MRHARGFTPSKFRSRPAVFSVVVLALVACADPPDVRFADGGGADWQDWRGQWVLVNYWAEWCGPCREEIPELNRLNDERAGVRVLGVNFDGVDGAALEALADEMGIEFPVLLEDPRERWDEALPKVLPTTFLVDPDGRLHDVLVGPQTFESLSRAIDEA